MAAMLSITAMAYFHLSLNSSPETSVAAAIFFWSPMLIRVTALFRSSKLLWAPSTAWVHFWMVAASVFQKPARSTQLLARPARSTMSAHTSEMALRTVSTMPRKRFSIPELTASPASAILPILSAKLFAATVPIWASRSAFLKPSPSPSRSFFMPASVALALFSFCSHFWTSSSLSPYFSRTSSRAFV